MPTDILHQNIFKNSNEFSEFSIAYNSVGNISGKCLFPTERLTAFSVVISKTLLFNNID